MSSDDLKKELVKQVMKNTGLRERVCTKYLEHNKYDLENTLKEIYEKVNNGSIEVVGSISSGVVYGNISNASSIYGTDKFNTPRGHGFAAEYANHLHDKVKHGDFFGNEKGSR